jgi:hypothetical protein
LSSPKGILRPGAHDAAAPLQTQLAQRGRNVLSFRSVPQRP